MRQAERDDGRQRFPAAALSLLVLLASLIALTAAWGVARERDDLTARAQRVLDEAGFGGLSVEVAGRDVALSGAVPSDPDAAAAEALVYRLEGVRGVDRTGVTSSAGDGTGDTPPPTAPAAAVQGASIVITVEDGRVALTGAAPSGEVPATLAATLGEVFPGADLAEDVTVSADVANPGWLGELAGVVRALDGMESGTVSISDAGVVVDGFAADTVAIESIDASLRTASALTVEVALVPIGVPRIVVVAGGDAVALEGTLARQADVDALVEAAEAHFVVVDSRLEAGGVRRSAWVEALPGVFAATTGWTQWRLEIDADRAAFGGRAPSSAALARIRDGHLAQLGTATSTFEAEVAPDALATELTELLAGSAPFVSGSAELSGDAEALLEEVIALLTANPSTRLTVEGHTDDQGSAAGNVALSEARAQAVVDFVVAGGVDAARLRAVGYGEERPIADNGTAEGRAQNRRIAFVVETEGDS